MVLLFTLYKKQLCGLVSVHQWKVFIFRDRVTIAIFPQAVYIIADAQKTQVL
jgi:hypothetical protein